MNDRKNVILVSTILVPLLATSIHSIVTIVMTEYDSFMATEAKSYREAPAQESDNSGQSSEIPAMTVLIPQGASLQSAPIYYNPENLSVSNGSVVTWRNIDVVAHTSTARDGSFDTGLIGVDQSGSAEITGQGNKPYFCTIHPWMTASLTIE